MSIKVYPMTKTEGSGDLPEEVRKSGTRSLGKMPTIFVAESIDGEGKVNDTAAVGFRYRRASHHCELTYWGGSNYTLLGEALKACIIQMIVEGRKRAELLVEMPLDRERDKDYKVSPRGGEMFCRALDMVGFKREGRLKHYTKYLEDVAGYSWLTLEQGLPPLLPETQVYVGENETTRKYREKNVDLYRKDRDYYAYTSADPTKTFAEILEEQYQWVKDNPQVTICEDWVSK